MFIILVLIVQNIFIAIFYEMNEKPQYKTPESFCVRVQDVFKFTVEIFIQVAVEIALNRSNKNCSVLVQILSGFQPLVQRFSCLLFIILVHVIHNVFIAILYGMYEKPQNVMPESCCGRVQDVFKLTVEIFIQVAIDNLR